MKMTENYLNSLREEVENMLRKSSLLKDNKEKIQNETLKILNSLGDYNTYELYNVLDNFQINNKPLKEYNIQNYKTHKNNIISLWEASVISFVSANQSLADEIAQSQLNFKNLASQNLFKHAGLTAEDINKAFIPQKALTLFSLALAKTKKDIFEEYDNSLSSLGEETERELKSIEESIFDLNDYVSDGSLKRVLKNFGNTLLTNFGDYLDQFKISELVSADNFKKYLNTFAEQKNLNLDDKKNQIDIFFNFIQSPAFLNLQKINLLNGFIPHEQDISNINNMISYYPQVFPILDDIIRKANENKEKTPFLSELKNNKILSNFRVDYKSFDSIRQIRALSETISKKWNSELGIVDKENTLKELSKLKDLYVKLPDNLAKEVKIKIKEIRNNYKKIFSNTELLIESIEKSFFQKLADNYKVLKEASLNSNKKITSEKDITYKLDKNNPLINDINQKGFANIVVAESMQKHSDRKSKYRTFGYNLSSNDNDPLSFLSALQHYSKNALLQFDLGGLEARDTSYEIFNLYLNEGHISKSDKKIIIPIKFNLIDIDSCLKKINETEEYPVFNLINNFVNSNQESFTYSDFETSTINSRNQTEEYDSKSYVTYSSIMKNKNIILPTSTIENTARFLNNISKRDNYKLALEYKKTQNNEGANFDDEAFIDTKLGHIGFTDINIGASLDYSSIATSKSLIDTTISYHEAEPLKNFVRTGTFLDTYFQRSGYMVANDIFTICGNKINVLKNKIDNPTHLYYGKNENKIFLDDVAISNNIKFSQSISNSSYNIYEEKENINTSTNTVSAEIVLSEIGNATQYIEKFTAHIKKNAKEVFDSMLQFAFIDAPRVKNSELLLESKILDISITDNIKKAKDYYEKFTSSIAFQTINAKIPKHNIPFVDFSKTIAYNLYNTNKFQQSFMKDMQKHKKVTFLGVGGSLHQASFFEFNKNTYNLLNTNDKNTQDVFLNLSKTIVSKEQFDKLQKKFIDDMAQDKKDFGEIRIKPYANLLYECVLLKLDTAEPNQDKKETELKLLENLLGSVFRADLREADVYNITNLELQQNTRFNRVVNAIIDIFPTQDLINTKCFYNNLNGENIWADIVLNKKTAIQGVALNNKGENDSDIFTVYKHNDDLNKNKLIISKFSPLILKKAFSFQEFEGAFVIPTAPFETAKKALNKIFASIGFIDETKINNKYDLTDSSLLEWRGGRLFDTGGNAKTTLQAVIYPNQNGEFRINDFNRGVFGNASTAYDLAFIYAHILGKEEIFLSSKNFQNHLNNIFDSFEKLDKNTPGYEEIKQSIDYIKNNDFSRANLLNAIRSSNSSRNTSKASTEETIPYATIKDIVYNGLEYVKQDFALRAIYAKQMPLDNQEKRVQYAWRELQTRYNNILRDGFLDFFTRLDENKTNRNSISYTNLLLSNVENTLAKANSDNNIVDLKPLKDDISYTLTEETQDNYEKGFIEKFSSTRIDELIRLPMPRYLRDLRDEFLENNLEELKEYNAIDFTTHQIPNELKPIVTRMLTNFAMIEAISDYCKENDIKEVVDAEVALAKCTHRDIFNTSKSFSYELISGADKFVEFARNYFKNNLDLSNYLVDYKNILSNSFDEQNCNISSNEKSILLDEYSGKIPILIHNLINSEIYSMLTNASALTESIELLTYMKPKDASQSGSLEYSIASKYSEKDSQGIIKHSNPIDFTTFSDNIDGVMIRNAKTNLFHENDKYNIKVRNIGDAGVTAILVADDMLDTSKLDLSIYVGESYKDVFSYYHPNRSDNIHSLYVSANSSTQAPNVCNLINDYIKSCNWHNTDERNIKIFHLTQNDKTNDKFITTLNSYFMELPYSAKIEVENIRFTTTPNADVSDAFCLNICNDVLQKPNKNIQEKTDTSTIISHIKEEQYTELDTSNTLKSPVAYLVKDVLSAKNNDFSLSLNLKDINSNSLVSSIQVLVVEDNFYSLVNFTDINNRIKIDERLEEAKNPSEVMNILEKENSKIPVAISETKFKDLLAEGWLPTKTVGTLLLSAKSLFKMLETKMSVAIRPVIKSSENLTHQLNNTNNELLLREVLSINNLLTPQAVECENLLIKANNYFSRVGRQPLIINDVSQESKEKIYTFFNDFLKNTLQKHDNIENSNKSITRQMREIKTPYFAFALAKIENDSFLIGLSVKDKTFQGLEVLSSKDCLDKRFYGQFIKDESNIQTFKSYLKDTSENEILNMTCVNNCFEYIEGKIQQQQSNYIHRQ